MNTDRILAGSAPACPTEKSVEGVEAICSATICTRSQAVVTEVGAKRDGAEVQSGCEFTSLRTMMAQNRSKPKTLHWLI